MPATQDAGPAIDALLTRAISLHDRLAGRIHERHPTLGEQPLTFAVRRDAIRRIYRELRRVSLPKKATPRTLGQVYDALLERTILLGKRGAMRIDVNERARKKTGVYYTPPAIVEHVVESALAKHHPDRVVPGRPSVERSADDSRLRASRHHPIGMVLPIHAPVGMVLRILDPACGAGWFLLQALDWLKAWYQARGVAIAPANIIRHHLFGADIDPLAVEVTRLSLRLAGADAGGTSRNILAGNSLLGPDATPDGIDWHRAFPSIMDAGGFDVVLGNPPYVSYSGRQAQAMAAREREHVERIFPSQGWLTAHGLFIHRAVRDLSRRIVAMVVPEQVGHLAGYTAVREAVAAHSKLAQVRYWGEGHFAGAVTPVLTFVADREHAGPTCVEDARGGAQSVVLTRGEAWEKPTISGLFERLMRCSRLLGEEVGDPGVHTGNCAAKLIDSGPLSPWERVRVRAESVPSIEIEISNAPAHSALTPALSQGERGPESPLTLRDRNIVPILEGRQITRYACASPARTLRLDYKPAQGEYFRIGPRQRFTDAPFLIRQTAAHPIVGPRRGADYFRNSLLALYPPRDGTDILYLVGLLNSRLMRFLYTRLVRESRQQAFPQVKVRSLRMLPIRRIDFSVADDRVRHDEIVTLVREMLELCADATDKHRIAAQDAAIDRAVYALYGLSDTEQHEVDSVAD